MIKDFALTRAGTEPKAFLNYAKREVVSRETLRSINAENGKEESNDRIGIGKFQMS